MAAQGVMQIMQNGIKIGGTAFIPIIKHCYDSGDSVVV